MPHKDTLAEPLEAAWNECCAVFGSDNILLVSNSAGSSSDPQGLGAESVSSHLGVPVLCHTTKKPGSACVRQVVEHFQSLSLRRAEPALPLHVLVVGDRISTDMVFSHRIARQLREADQRAQCTSILTTQLWGRESLFTTALRALESSVLRQLARIGIPPGGSWYDQRMSPSSALHDWISIPAVPTSSESVLPSPQRSSWVQAIRSRTIDPLKRSWLAMTHELFTSVRHIRQLTWSVFTAAPTKQWRSSWRQPHGPSQSARQWPPPSCTHRISTYAPRSTDARRPLPRSPPTQKAQTARSLSSASSPPRTSTLFGIPWTRWVLALMALILLPTGFIGGIKLNELVDWWRSGDLSHEGEDLSTIPQPEVQEAVDASLSHESRTQQRKKIMRYVGQPKLEYAVYNIRLVWSLSIFTCAASANAL